MGLFISVAVSIINTHSLGATEFGVFKFVQTLFIFTLTLSTMGFYVAGGRLMAHEEKPKARADLSGALIMVALLVYTILTVFVFIYTFLDFEILRGRQSNILIQVIPVAVALPLHYLLENTLKGENRIYELSILRVMPGIIYLICAYIYENKYGLGLHSALNIYLSSMLVVCVAIIMRIRPSFKNISPNIIIILHEVRRYGIHVYLGIVANVGTMQLAGLSIAFFIDAKAVGFYLLAKTVSSPLGMIGSNIGTTLFRSFSSAEYITRRVFVITISVVLLSLAVYLIIIGPFFNIIYPAEFSPALKLAYILGVGSVLQGLGDFMNNFLCANGQGKKTRNAAFVQGILNIIGFTVLVFWLGATGAALAYVISSCGYMLTIVYYYKVLVRDSSHSGNITA